MKARIYVVLLVVSLASLLYVTQKEMREAKREVARLEKTLKRALEFEAKTDELNQKINQDIKDLQGHRGREDTVIARPGLVENLINKSFKEQQEAIACLTGGTCEEQQ